MLIFAIADVKTVEPLRIRRSNRRRQQQKRAPKYYRPHGTRMLLYVSDPFIRFLRRLAVSLYSFIFFNNPLYSSRSDTRPKSMEPALTDGDLVPACRTNTCALLA